MRKRYAKCGFDGEDEFLRLLFRAGDGEAAPIGKAGSCYDDHTRSLLEELYMDDASVDATILRLERIGGVRFGAVDQKSDQSIQEKEAQETLRKFRTSTMDERGNAVS